MKKLINLLLIVTLSFFALTSCVTTVEAQDGVYTTTVIDTDNIEMAIVYGTPYIVNGVVLYYLYNNLYYYPFYTGGHYYYNVYTRPLARYPRYWNPVPRTHWFRDGRYHNPHGFIWHNKFRDRRPDINHHRPNIRHNDIRRPSSTRYRSTAPNRHINPSTPRSRVFGGTHSRGHFGGRR